MVIEVIATVMVLGCCLVVLLRQPGGEPSRPDLKASLDVIDDNDLFCGWDELLPVERKQRLNVYQQRVRARIAEQERAWLKERLRECAKG